MKKKGTAFLGIIFLIGLIHLTLQPTNLVQDIDERARQIAYELRFSTFQSKKASPKIGFVHIDDASYPEELSKYPVDRGYLADLISSVSEKGAAVIGLNVVLDSPTDPGKDRMLADAIAGAKSVILRDGLRHKTLHIFKNAALDSGVMSWRFDSAGTLQTACDSAITCGSNEIFHQKLWRHLYPESPFDRQITVKNWLEINFELFDSSSTRAVSYNAADLKNLSEGVFKNKLVLIGPSFEGLSPRYKTPLYQAGSDGMREIEVLNQLLQMQISGHRITSVNAYLQLLLLIIVLALGAATAMMGRYLLFSLQCLFSLLIWVCFAVALFAFYRIDLPFVLIAVEIALFYLLSILVLLNFERFTNLLMELELEKKSSLLKTAKIEHLSNQLNTHNLFNEFSRLRGLIVVDPKKARDYLVHFTNMLKYSLLYSDKEATALETQIEFLNFYIEQQQSVSNQIKFDFEIKGATENVYLPWNALFVLLENAVKHTEPLQNRASDKVITIRLTIDKGRIRYSVVNAFDEKKTVPSTLTGLDNLKQRLELYYKDLDYSLAFRNDSCIWTSELDLPSGI